jgi:hypothetical protein
MILLEDRAVREKTQADTARGADEPKRIRSEALRRFHEIRILTKQCPPSHVPPE